MIVRIDYPEPSVRLDLWGGVSGAFAGLDQFNRIIDQRWQNQVASTSTDIDRYQYGYDQNSNRTYKANVVGTPIITGGLDEFYAYDPLNRLTEMQRGVLNGTKTGITGTPSVEQDWTLDPTGNWAGFVTKASGTTDLNQARTANKVNEITDITESTGPTWAMPAYDAAGNTTTMPQVGDPTQSFTAVYDAWNRMVRISDPSETVATYAYDARNRRIVKTTATETRHFYFTDQWQDVEERIGTSTAMDKQYVCGVRYVDELICRDDATPQTLYACQDANYNLTTITDTSGAVKERYLFDPYGDRTIMEASWSIVMASAYAWAIGHQGLLGDLDTAFIYNRRRFQSPLLGRFYIIDPIFSVLGLNLYEYVRSRPTVLLDPLGTLPLCGGVENSQPIELYSSEFAKTFLIGDNWSGSQLKNQGQKWQQVMPNQAPPGFTPSGPHCRVWVIDDCIRQISFHPLYSNDVEGIEQLLNQWNELARSHENDVINEFGNIFDPPIQLCDCDMSEDQANLQKEKNQRLKQFQNWLKQNHNTYFPTARSILNNIMQNAPGGVNGQINW